MTQKVKKLPSFSLKTLFRNDAQAIMVMVAIWIIIGSLNIYSATSVDFVRQDSFFSSNIVKHIIYLTLGLFLGRGVYRLDYRRLKDEKFLNIISLFLIVLLVAVFAGVQVNGAYRWISLPFGVSIQPSEFAKLGGIIWTCKYIEDWRKRYPHVELLEKHDLYGRRFTPPFTYRPTKALWAPIVFAGLTLIEPDTGTAMLILAFPLLLMIIGKMSRTSLTQLKYLGFMGIIGFIILIWVSDYRRDRILAWWDLWGHSLTKSFQSVQSLVAIGSGGIFGQGLGEGTAKYFYLPEAHTDFAFAVWAQETGILGALFLAIVIFLFVVYGLRVAADARDLFGKLLAIGITCLIGGQAFFNMLMVCGVLPVTGVPLPFVSYGGSSLLMNIFAVSILLSISRSNELANRQIGAQGVAPSLREETRSRFRPSSVGTK